MIRCEGECAAACGRSSVRHVQHRKVVVHIRFLATAYMTDGFSYQELAGALHTNRCTFTACT